MQRPLEDGEIENLRTLQSEVNDAIESRIRNEEAAGEKVRRATQALQIAGMGQHQYWETQIAQPLKNISLILAQELNILPIINSSDVPITATEIASKCGADELLISRIMRPLLSSGIALETSRNTYLANSLSRIAASQGGKAGVKIWNELLFPIASKLIPYVREHGFEQFPDRSKGRMDPTQFAHEGKTMFEYFREEEGREMKGWFDTLMVENRASNIPWFHIYPFTEQIPPCDSAEDVLLVDVGGNRGEDLREFHEAFPDLKGRLVLQDLPETLEGVDKTKMGRIEVMGYDFFTPQLVKNAKAYFWRWVLHDFNDEMVRDFLGNTVRAMGKSSRLLIEELVLPNTGVDVKCAHLDMLMMLYHSGMERSLGQWTELLDSCGLRILKVWKRVDADPSILECVLK